MTTDNRLGHGRLGHGRLGCDRPGHGHLGRFTAASVAFLLTVAPAAAAVDPFADLPAVAGAQLAEMRGGIMIGGIPVDFAVVLNTTIRNSVDAAVQPAVSLQTTLANNNAGTIANASTTTTMATSAPASTGTVPAGTGPAGTGPAGTGPAGTVATTTVATTLPAATTSSATTTSSPAVTPATAIATNNGNPTMAPVTTMATTPDGATNILQQVTPAQVQTVIANATNGAIISHSTTVNVTLPNILQTTRNFTSHFQASAMGLESAIAGLRR